MFEDDGALAYILR